MGDSALWMTVASALLVAGTGLSVLGDGRASLATVGLTTLVHLALATSAAHLAGEPARHLQSDGMSFLPTMSETAAAARLVGELVAGGTIGGTALWIVWRLRRLRTGDGAGGLIAIVSGALAVALVPTALWLSVAPLVY